MRERQVQGRQNAPFFNTLALEDVSLSPATARLGETFLSCRPSTRCPDLVRLMVNGRSTPHVNPPSAAGFSTAIVVPSSVGGAKAM